LQVAPEKVEWLRTLPTMSFSLDEPGEGDESDFEMDTLVDPRASNVEDAVSNKLRDESLERCVDRLDARTADVVRRYYGLGGIAPESLESIGKAYGVTRERVRQLRDRGIYKLRMAPECVPLAES
jgi:RNA polymerase primary sigma factor